jgi:hypothetical protein
VTFALYVFGIMEPYVPLSELHELWSKNVHDYLSDAKIDSGWGWTSMLAYGDFVNFIGIAVLAGVTVLCYLVILPILLGRKDIVYVILALLEVIVLVVAASGIIEIGH